MTENSTTITFEFPIFRYIRLLYSIPFFFASVFAFVWLANLWSFDQEALPWWLSGIAIPIVITLIGSITIVKSFYCLSTKVVLITIDAEGIQLQLPSNRKIRWSQVKHYDFPKEYPHEGSTLVLGFGFMKKPKFIHCSTWTIFNKTKRKYYEQQYKEFKKLVEHYLRQSRLEEIFPPNYFYQIDEPETHQTDY